MLAVLLAVVWAHPSNIICDDPRFVDGGKMMGGYVTLNELTEDIVITASAERYAYNASVDFEIVANGSRFVGDVAGVYIAIQYVGAGEAQGLFTDLSDDLAMTTNCATSAYSQTEFNGSSRFTWTPSYYPWESGILKTTGNATFKLVWSNGPGGSDPMSQSLGVPNTYLYMKTLTLLPPDDVVVEEDHDVAPAAVPCVQSFPHEARSIRGVEHAFRGAPVFLTDKGVLPASQCLKTSTGSARVDCPTMPGQPTKETTYATNDCSGTSKVSATADVVCPPPKFWDPKFLDLKRFETKLVQEHPTEIPNVTVAKKAIAEYRRVLTLAQNGAPLVPSRLVDLAWHAHILDTRAYAADSQRLFGRFLHHAPSFGDDGDDLREEQAKMLAAYKKTYGATPPDIWSQKSPDCCAAKCVKPSCAGCVGCNAIDCGYYFDDAAYEPTGSQPYVYDYEYPCSVSMGKLTLDWGIVDDAISFNLTSKAEAWFGVGLANVSSTDMSLADYMLTLLTKNYTGTFDMYKWDPGNGYPCFDVEYECSSDNATVGTKDVENAVMQRSFGYTWSSWTRALITPDSKDWPIDGPVKVLFAYGTDDAFTYHQHNFGSCIIDFHFNNVSDCVWGSS